jgi:hypothetical protein
LELKRSPPFLTSLAKNGQVEQQNNYKSGLIAKKLRSQQLLHSAAGMNRLHIDF